MKGATKGSGITQKGRVVGQQRGKLPRDEGITERWYEQEGGIMSGINCQ